MVKDLLRFIMCGSVDDGKSTLIGRLLCDTGAVPDDLLQRLAADSKRFGAEGDTLDYALLLDGLAAEREQGITIDVAYRFFGTAKRRFIVADAPGHEQYTRNMATGASTADLAVVLADARKGVLTQTRRHTHIAHLLGVRQIVLAVTKMDMVGYAREPFEEIAAAYQAFARDLGVEKVTMLPVSGRAGDNVAARSPGMTWYSGPSLLEVLETAEIEEDPVGTPFRMPVQWVNRPTQEFRGFAGTVAMGEVAVDDPVRVLPSGATSKVARIVTADGDLQSAAVGQAITLCLADEIDCSRGDVLVASAAPPQAGDQFEASLIWLSETPLLPGRGYWLKLATQLVTAQVQAPKYEVDVNTMARMASRTLALNGIGVANLSTDRPLVFESYAQSREMGGFILIDKITNATVAAGMLHFALRRSQNLHWQASDVTRAERAALKAQNPAVLWLTGLSGAGKSTIANLVEKKLAAAGRHTILLDGDNVRHGLNKNLGFSEADRIENIRRVGEVAKLMTDAGLIVITAFISPFRAEREMVRKMMAEGEFIEVFVDTPLDIAELRDVKGLYKKARAGVLKNFTGIDSPYEPPITPELRIDTTQMSAEQAAEAIVQLLLR